MSLKNSLKALAHEPPSSIDWDNIQCLIGSELLLQVKKTILVLETGSVIAFDFWCLTSSSENILK
ncbi:hypothetical protein X801_01243, partial [Opisthorchis viverrini]